MVQLIGKRCYRKRDWPVFLPQPQRTYGSVCLQVDQNTAVTDTFEHIPGWRCGHLDTIELDYIFLIQNLGIAVLLHSKTLQNEK